MVKVTAIKGFVYPWALAFLPNGDMLVTEQGKNTLRRVSQGVLDPAPITGLPHGHHQHAPRHGRRGHHRDPRFAENHFIYVTYWKPKAGDPDIRTAVLIRARYDGGSTLQDVKPIFEATSVTDGPSAARLVFGRDGKLYMGSATQASTSATGQQPTRRTPARYLGKILRLNDDGTVPPDNPFVGKRGYKPEIFALGIRNAIGLTLHPETGEIWETENGPQGGDESTSSAPA